MTRYPALDGLRGAAAIAIMVYHLGVKSGHTALAPFGFLAVDLFFMMSGFVMARTYEPRLAGSMTFWRFMVVRLARIYPLLLLAVVTGLVVGMATHTPYDQTDVASALLLVPNLGAATLFPINAVLWSLFYELTANIAHGAVAPWLTKARVAGLAVTFGGLFMVSIWMFRSSGLGWDGQSFVGGFARAGWGYSVGLLFARLNVPVSRRLASGFTAATLMLLFSPAIGPGAARTLLSLFFVFPLSIVAAANVADWKAAAVAEWLGSVSFPLYAIHLPLMSILALSTKTPAEWLIGGAALVLLAWLVERFYDAPLRNTLKLLVSRTPTGVRKGSRNRIAHD